MKATIEGKELVIRVPLNDPPKPSSTGKSVIIAGTGGFSKTGLDYNGKQVSISINACVPIR